LKPTDLRTFNAAPVNLLKPTRTKLCAKIGTETKPENGKYHAHKSGILEDVDGGRIDDVAACSGDVEDEFQTVAGVYRRELIPRRNSQHRRIDEHVIAKPSGSHWLLRNHSALSGACCHDDAAAR